MRDLKLNDLVVYTIGGEVQGVFYFKGFDSRFGCTKLFNGVRTISIPTPMTRKATDREIEKWRKGEALN